MTRILDKRLLVLTCMHSKSGPTSPESMVGLASSKMQLEPLFRAANKLELQPRLMALDANKPSYLGELGNPEVCMIGKINHYEEDRVEGFAMAILAAVARMKARNAKIVLMYCDHLASLDCARGYLYRELLFLADHCIVPSQSMAALARRFLKNTTDLTIIEDPWQVRLQPYRSFSSADTLRIAWFGSNSNCQYVCQRLEGLMSSINAVSSVEFVMLSKRLAYEMVKPIFEEALSRAQRNWSLVSHIWDQKQQPDQLESVLGSSHVAWIPSNPADLLKSGISHNRLVDSVRSGCIPVASKMASYLELQKVALLGEDHASLINAMVRDYDRLVQKYEKIRINYLDRFSPDINAGLWESLLIHLFNLSANKMPA